MTTPQLLTAEQLAERWQVSPSHVYRLTWEGRIPVVKLGRYYRYRPDAIDHFELQGVDERLERVPGPPRCDLTPRPGPMTNELVGVEEPALVLREVLRAEFVP